MDINPHRCVTLAVLLFVIVCTLFILVSYPDPRVNTEGAKEGRGLGA